MTERFIVHKLIEDYKMDITDTYKEVITLKDLVDYLNDITNENKNAKQSILFLDNECKQLEDLNNNLRERIHKLTGIKEEEPDNSPKTIEEINEVYRESGFKGVMEYTKMELSKYGLVTEVDEGVWLVATGGWSSHENFVDCLNDPMCLIKMMGHYSGFLSGGGFYYVEDPMISVKIIRRDD